MDPKKLFALLAEKKVSACDTGLLGYQLGHLTDHGLTNVEIRALVDFLLDGITKIKADPALVHDIEKFHQGIAQLYR